MIITLATIGIWQYILAFILILCIFVFPIFLVIYKREEKEHNIPWWAKIFLIIPSLTWLGLLPAFYIILRKRKYPDGKHYKFDTSTRRYGVFLAVLSVLSVTFLIIREYNFII